jgi:hypothetical protein
LFKSAAAEALNPSQCGDSEIRQRQMPALSEFRNLCAALASLILLVCFLNPKFALSSIHKQANFRFRTLARSCKASKAAVCHFQLPPLSRSMENPAIFISTP